MDSSPTHLLLIRHAPIDTGPSPGRLCGWLDLPLSHQGRMELERLRRSPLLHEPPDALYTSTSSRALEVAGALAALWRIEPVPREEVREIGCGRFEGKSIESVEREHAALWERNEAQSDDDFAWPGGESYRAFRERVSSALDRIAASHPARRVAVVTHAGVIAQVVGIIQGRAAAEWKPGRPDPLTATEITWAIGSPGALLSFNRRDWL